MTDQHVQLRRLPKQRAEILDARLFLLQVYQGMGYSELQRTGAHNLQPHSVASTLTRMKRQLRRVLSAPG